MLAIPHSDSEMWTEGREGGREAAEGRRVYVKTEGEEEMREREKEREGGGKIGSVLQPQVKKKLLLC